jgi:hypothetical protein
MGDSQLSLKSFQPILPAAAFRHRLAMALRRRFGPGLEMSVKQAAHAVGCTPQQMHNLLNGRCNTSAWLVAALIELCGPTLLIELYGELGGARWRRRIERLEADAAKERQAARQFSTSSRSAEATLRLRQRSRAMTAISATQSPRAVAAAARRCGAQGRRCQAPDEAGACDAASAKGRRRGTVSLKGDGMPHYRIGDRLKVTRAPELAGTVRKVTEAVTRLHKAGCLAFMDVDAAADVSRGTIPRGSPMPAPRSGPEHPILWSELSTAQQRARLTAYIPPRVKALFGEGDDHGGDIEKGQGAEEGQPQR